MKNNFLLLAIILSVTLLFSCQKKEEPQIAHDNDYIENIYEPATTVSNIRKAGFVLPVTSSLYVIDGEDDGTEATKARWGANMTLGENILIGEPRRLTWTDGRILNFIEIRRETGAEGFALTSQVVEGGRLAVVIDERASLYTSPRTVDVSSTIMSRMSVVVYYPESESNGYVEIRGWDHIRERYVDPSTSFVRLNTLSTGNSDIQSCILLHTALSLTAANQAVRRETLLESAILDYPDSVFNFEIYLIAYPPNPVNQNNEEDYIYND